MCRVQEYGIPAHYGLLSSLGAAMMMVALLSATYHVCPNALNFQFGTNHNFTYSINPGVILQELASVSQESHQFY